MAAWNRQSVKRIIEEKDWYASEREIQHAYQFTLTDGTKINCFHTGNVSVQGKNTDIKREASLIFSERSVSSKRQPRSETITGTALTDFRRRVFIVYGHDRDAREQLEHRIRKFRHDPVVLESIPGGGDTIIEKLEHATEADFACVLLTPDDEGRKFIPDENKRKKLRPRARQNVVLELGMVLSRLGRSRVAILVKGDTIEYPSDIDGLIYIRFSDHVDEAKNDLAANLQNAGFNIRVEDLSK